MKVQFSNVGRNKKSWVADLKQTDEAAIEREVHKSGALMSSGIDICFTSATKGEIVVGVFRVVGTFEILAPAQFSAAFAV